jgi:lipopolysaccharide transport system ATP-binding protein
MNAAVLGLGKEEIDAKFDDIIRFADIGDFIEQPVKTYSSGMVVRLSFAVAINVDPEILVIDEALSVGDELFQRKCFSRIEAIRASGATILFVSHSGAQIVELCDRALLIDAGEKLAVGLPKQIVGRYQKLLYAPANMRETIREQIRKSFQLAFQQEESLGEFVSVEDSTSRGGANKLKAGFDPHLKPASTIYYESHGALIEDPQIITLQGEQVNNLVRGEVYRYAYTVKFSKNASNVRFGMLIKTTSGTELGGAITSASMANAIPFVEAGRELRVEFRFNANLNTGVYFMNAGVLGQGGEEDGYLNRLVDIAMFRILPDSDNHVTAIVDFGCVPEVEMIEA